MTHQPSTVDPRPDLPECFRHSLGTPANATNPPPSEAPDHTPKTLFRTAWPASGQRRFRPPSRRSSRGSGFYSAKHGAFVGDGLAYNWTIHRRHFSSFTPILDFVHASEHLHALPTRPTKPANPGSHSAGKAACPKCSWRSPLPAPD